MSITIPKAPKATVIRVDRLHNGSNCPDTRLWADVKLSQLVQGLHIFVEAPILHEQMVPDAPIGSRVDGLWEFDVVELFFVGPGHEYVELELGAGGHFLFLSFNSVRHCANNHVDFKPVVRYKKTSNKTWTSEITLPWKFLPENMRAMNAFMIAAGKFLAYSPVVGAVPDFHQPDQFPNLILS